MGGGSWVEVGAMLGATLQGLLARRGRLVLTAVAVLAGVALVTGTLMLTDAVGRSVRRLTAGARAGVDVVVDNADDPDAGPPRAIRPGLVAAVAAAPGVAAVSPVVVGEKATMVGRDGRPIHHRRASNLVLSWPADPALAAGYTLGQGRPPAGDGEAVLDAATARAGGWRLGDLLGIVGADAALHRFRVVGVTGFAGAPSPAAELATFDTPTVAVLSTAAAQRLLGRGDTVDEVWVRAAPGVGPDTLRDRIAGQLPAGRLEAVTAATLAARQAGELQGYLAGLRATLLAFAAVALLVGSFIIWNTFSVLVAGRTRELALLRLLGATRGQVLGSVLFEAALVGLVAAAAGVAAGVGAAVGLAALLRGLGDTLPPAGPLLAPRTVVAGLAVGTLVTMAAAAAPARRVGRVAPLAAIREAAPSTPPPAGPARAAAGLGFAMAGAAGMVASLVVATRTAVLGGLGALAAVVGVMVLGPVLARPLCRAVGAPLARLFGFAARLARDNLLGNPRRSAATVGALTVGLVLAAGTGVLASSSATSIRDRIRAGSHADLYLEGALPRAAVARLAALPEVDAALPVTTGHVHLGGARVAVDGIDPGPAGRVLDLGLRAGSLQALDRPGGGLLVSARLADEHGWRVGDLVPVGFSEVGTTRRLPVVGVFTRDPLFGSDLLAPIDRYVPLGHGQADQTLLRTAPGTDPARLAAAVHRVLAGHPEVTVTDPATYRRQRAGDLGDLGGVLGLLTALVVLAAAIATLGIANTPALAVVERTRELGLLRAVGMTARQLGAMVRWESVIVTISGALLGLSLGVAAGAAVARAATVQQAGVATVALPAGQLLVDLTLAGAAGLVAAAVPAHRAARLDLRTAIGLE
jgi:putative ABC transport system permease protein